MVELEKNELVNITGGASKKGIGIIIGIVCTFIAGVIDGFMRPLKCH